MSKSRRKQQQTTRPADRATPMGMTGARTMPDGSVERDVTDEREEEGFGLGDTLKAFAGEAWHGITGAFGLDGETHKDDDIKNDAPGVRG